MYKKRTILTTLFSIGFVCFCIYTGLLVQVISGETAYTPEPSGAIIVLGHAVYNGEPSEWLVLRLDLAVTLYNEGYSDTIIVTGGKDKSELSAAEVMYDYLISRGIPSSSVITESKARNTNENMKFSKEIIDSLGIDSVIVVTNDFHIYRSVYTADSYFENISGAAAETAFSFRKLLNYLKEPLSLIKQFLTGE